MTALRETVPPPGRASPVRCPALVAVSPARTCARSLWHLGEFRSSPDGQQWGHLAGSAGRPRLAWCVLGRSVPNGSAAAGAFGLV